MEVAIIALLTAIVQTVFQWLKNGSQDRQIARLSEQATEMQTAIDECHQERSQLWKELGDRMDGNA